MKPLDFVERNQGWAANQPPYLPLPAYSDEKETITCWALSWRERVTVHVRRKGAGGEWPPGAIPAGEPPPTQGPDGWTGRSDGVDMYRVPSVFGDPAEVIGDAHGVRIVTDR